MTYRVLSDRLPEPPGTLIEDWPGTNMAALVEAGHLELVDEGDREPADKPKKRGAS